jgi:hypothetical protein
MKDALIDFLFKLLGNSNTRLYSVQYLFGATTMSHEARKKRWERALARLWKDKDLLDYLYYQSETDKEIAFKGKTSKLLSKGARLRTLFIVRSAHRAFLEQIKTKQSRPDERGASDVDMQKVEKAYKDIVDVAEK